MKHKLHVRWSTNVGGCSNCPSPATNGVWQVSVGSVTFRLCEVCWNGLRSTIEMCREKPRRKP